MFARASPSEPAATAFAAVPHYVRATSAVNARFERLGTATRLADCFETGGLRLRLPNSAAGCDAVLINIAGGMTGGDESRLSCTLGRNARVRVTTQSAEKLYRAEGVPAVVSVDLALTDGAKLDWIPQETILFDGSRLTRTLTANLAASASLLVLEMTVFGRVARDETLGVGAFRDRWRIRREDRLVFADDIRLDGDIGSLLAPAALGGGARAIATLLYVAPSAESRLNAVRAALTKAVSNAGASAWNGLLVVRFAGCDAAAVRRDVALTLQRLTRMALPRIWAA